MRIRLKQTLFKAGLFPILDNVRRLPQAFVWISRGCLGPAPTGIKRSIIKSYLKRYQLREFIEKSHHCDTRDRYNFKPARYWRCQATLAEAVSKYPKHRHDVRERLS